MSEMSGLRARLHSPGALIATMMSIPDSGVAATLGYAGFDCVIIDAEHGPFDISSMRACIDTLLETPAYVLVRVASPGSSDIQRILDLGVDGVVVAHIETVEDAQAAVSATRYPPEGTRGLGGMRPGRAALSLSEANAQTAVIALIESQLGVQNASEIVAVSGLDGVIVGPGDLSADLGVFPQMDHPKVKECIEAVAKCTIAAGLNVGTLGQTHSNAESTMNICFADMGGLQAAAKQAAKHAQTNGAGTGTRYFLDTENDRIEEKN